MKTEYTALAFDTCMQGISLGICDLKKGVAENRIFERPYGQAEILVSEIKAILRDFDLRFSDLDFIVTTRGPGTFTGLRIGLSVANMLAISLKIPVPGVSSLEAMSTQAQRHIQQQNKNLQEKCFFAVILETKRKDFYFQIFDADLSPVTECASVEGEVISDTISEFDPKNIILAGDAVKRFCESFSKHCDEFISVYECNNIDGTVLIQQGQKILMEHYDQESGEIYTHKPEPLYLHGADVSKPKTGFLEF